MDELTSFQRDLLYAIAGLDSPKGLDVKDVLDEYYPEEINYGRLYSNLDALVEMGLVRKGQKDDRTNEYTLTEDGEQLLIDRREWEDKISGKEM